MLKCKDQSKLKSEFTFPSYLSAPNISSSTLGPQINFHLQLQTLGFFNRRHRKPCGGSQINWDKRKPRYSQNIQLPESKFSRT